MPTHQAHQLQSHQLDYVVVNDSAVGYLKAGAMDKAIGVYRKALQTISDRLQLASDSPVPPLATFSSEHHQTNLIIRTSINPGNNYGMSSCDQNSLILHTTPFRFSYINHAGDASPISAEDPLMLHENDMSNLVSGIFLVNEAICLHLRAIQQNRTEFEFHQINQLYETAAQALQRNYVHPDFIPDVEECRVLCAVYNNMACISCQYFDMEGTRENLNMLHYLLALHHEADKGDLPLFKHDPNFLAGISTRQQRCHRQLDENEKDAMLQYLNDRHFLWNVSVIKDLWKFSPAA